MGLNFSNILSDMKRKARLQGRPVSQQEVAGVAEGSAREATGRLGMVMEQERHEKSLAQQKLMHDEEMRQNEMDRKAAEKSSRMKTMIGGATAGFAAGGPWGALFGAGAGLILGGKKSCIIITACTSRDSHEVEISREFRDKYMSGYHLGGYYALAEAVTPLIKRFDFLRLITKRFLVDRLVDYGEWVLKHKPERRLRTSRIVTAGFLALCASIGKRIDVQPFIEAHR